MKLARGFIADGKICYKCIAMWTQVTLSKAKARQPVTIIGRKRASFVVIGNSQFGIGAVSASGAIPLLLHHYTIVIPKLYHLRPFPLSYLYLAV